MSNLYYFQTVGPNLVMLSPMTDPGYGGGRPGGVDPGFGVGGGFRPDNSLPGGGGHPDQGLPGGGHISNRPPGSGGGGIPSNELPDTPPPNVAPGATLVLIRHEGKWAYAVIAPGSPPPRPLPPGEIERPDTGGPRPPHASGQPVPPTAQPQRR